MLRSVAGTLRRVSLMKNTWNHVKASSFDALKTSVDSYVHQRTGMRLHIAQIPGPICSCMIVVPTETNNNMGLPHTLEHLVFLGSKSIPFRGYLDIFANRCLATGTNAYTAEDHTCFNVSTAGFEGMLNILPVFLDYVLHPELSDSNFHTEIYHVDGEGKELGVVYCEMLGRENTEEDLKDYSMNRLLYQGTGYASYTGGKTIDIATLTNEMIKEYHKKHYDPSRISVLLQGQIDHQAVFEALEKVDYEAGRNPDLASARPSWADSIPPLLENRSEIVRFPSEEESVGSVAIGWQGPPITDVDTSVALHVLFRYLQETSASPIHQRFVERASPLASGVDFGMRNYKVSQLVLEMDGVPMKWSKSDEGVQEDEESGSGSGSGGETGSGSASEGTSEGESEESESESDSGSEDDEAHDPEDDHEFDANLLAPNAMYMRLDFLLRKLLSDGFPSLDVMQKAVRRHKVKFMESLEDDPQDFLSELLIPDILFSSTDVDPDNGDKLGRWFNIANILDELENKEQQFWLDLLKKWLVDAPHVEIIMIPDKKLASEMSEQSQKNVQQRIANIGTEGLVKLKEKLQKSVEENSTPLPPHLAAFPAIPDGEKIPVLPVIQKFVTDRPSQPFPIQTCELQSQFCHMRLVFYIKDLPNELRPKRYLAIFQELLFETDLQLSPDTHIRYTDAVKQMSDELVSIECGVGFGSTSFACDMLPEIFYICELTRLHTLCKWLNDVLYGAIFPTKRILTIVSNLLSDAHEESRDGQSVAAALCTGIIDFDLWQKDQSSNNVAISIFKQIPFLQSLKEDLKSGSPEKISKIAQSLYKVKEYLWSNNSRIFAQLSYPPGLGDPVDVFLSHWKTAQSNLSFYNNLSFASSQRAEPSRPARGGRRGAKKSEKNNKSKKTKAVEQPKGHFMTPFKRLVALGLESPKHVLSPIGGVESCFLYQLVHCPVDKKHPDCLPILVLGEMISLTEGPLYTKIRYAYDASLSFHLWSYALSLNLHECSSPINALSEFHDILRQVPTDEFLTAFALDTAKASLLYQFHSGRSNPSAMIAGCLRAILKGYSDIDEERQYEKKLNSVTKEQVLEVYHKYFKQFLEPNKCTLVITSNPGSVEELVQSFAKPPFNLSLSVCEIKDLLLK